MTLVRWFDDIGMTDVATVGGKNASLGEMRRALTPAGNPNPRRIRDYRRRLQGLHAGVRPVPGGAGH